MSQPVALAPEHQLHARKINQARHDPWGDPHGGGLTHAVMDAHRAGMPHSAIAHYSGLPIERVALMASVAKNHGDPFGLNKAYDWHNTKNNTRGQNSRRAAALYAPAGAVVGAHVSTLLNRRHKAIDPIRDAVEGHQPQKIGRTATSVGQRAPRVAAAGLKVASGVRHHGKYAAGGAALFAAQGALSGALDPAKKARRGKPVRVAKSATRMGEQAAEWTGHLPKHTAGAVAAGKSSFRAGIEMPGFVRPVKPGLRVQKPQFTRGVAKSAFGVEHEIEKKKIPNVLPGERRRATGKVVKVRSVGVKPDPQRGERGQRRVVRSGRL